MMYCGLLTLCRPVLPVLQELVVRMRDYLRPEEPVACQLTIYVDSAVVSHRPACCSHPPPPPSSHDMMAGGLIR